MPPSQTSTTPALGGSRWNTFPATGTMTAREFFTGTEPLLQGVIDALQSVDREILGAQIRATLGLGTRETSLPLAIGPDAASATRELGTQAEAIGQEIASWATAAVDRLLTHRIPLPAGPLVVRSHCYGHLLTHPATDLLMGRRGGPVTMQLYNEWLHQMVLLRDALLPFTNWKDVPLLVTPTGLRHTEPARDRFLTELLVRQIRHTSIVNFARHTVTGSSGPDGSGPDGYGRPGSSAPDGYGFDHDGGTVLPAVVDAPPLTAPRHLLTWRPDPAVGETATYVAEVRDYYAAPRTLIEHLPPATGTSGPITARIVAEPVVDGTRTAHVEVTHTAHNDATASIDLGQCLRGHRFAHRQGPAARAEAAGARDARTADTWAVLHAPGLVCTEGGDAVLDATAQDNTVVLAILGRLYPDHVVLRPAGHRAGPVNAAGNGPGRLVIDIRGEAHQES
ncbi:hypothetical protein SBI_07716 [Streptomyces bingchenggensis BCW-1]|uniref:Uncharacterized protein n=1 Tax=Streptomyces bingchenggensis (strain BCW-1) TaxID=749414 RepID=D7CCY9_STRBB|nr:MULTISPECIES: hypothetical protein [Streptomyces]ADI10836.1 hypothetical protein SBI_07716 [Streptomyces bingchenggensis BCW-1]